MRATGIVRHVDEAGRLVLPKELRSQFALLCDDAAVEIFTDNDTIILKKYAPACIFCNSLDNILEYHGSKVCSECAKELGKKVD